jgi:tRNA(Ile2)-agmatinylcytidine synthase
MTLWVGIDDTDSPKGGCTTFVLTELLALAESHGLDLIGPPRLVRLNPNIPWKTRGNAALSARFGRGEGRAGPVGEVRGRRLRCYARGRPPTDASRDRFLEAAWELVAHSGQEGEPGTDPAMVASSRPLPTRLYWKAVREVVPVAETRRELEAAGAWWQTRGSDRGLVGAAASIAWPGRRTTWELIAYRDPARYGRPREVDVHSVRAAQAEEPSLFLCFDPRTRRLLVAPHTPCPILFGLRSTTRGAPLRARRKVRSEPVERWVLFRTNQGTGDHLVVRRSEQWPEYRSGWITGEVLGRATPHAGGHVAFSVRPLHGPPVECLVFEPTKTLPRIVQDLEPGDRVRVWGSRAADPRVRVEGIEVLEWKDARSSAAPPRCDVCGVGSCSLGRMRGYYCPACGRRWPPEAAVHLSRAPPHPLGAYHPTPSARRHLAPLAPER